MDGGPCGRAQRDRSRGRQPDRVDHVGGGARVGGGRATGTRVNVALAASGATATASSTINVDYGPSAAIDGRRSGAVRGQLGTWEDATAATPDWLQVTFAAPATIDLVNVFSLQVNSSSPVEPTPTLTSYIAVEDFSVQCWNGAAWVLIPGSQVVGNNLVWRPVAFSPVTTTAIRIVVTKVYGNNTRLTEVEAWSPAGAPRPTATLSAAPATITLGGSSTLSWTTSGATSVSIDQGIGTMAATGAQLVAPTATTTYTLTATNSAGATTSTAVVTVQAAPPANTPPIVGLTAPTGGSVVTVATPVALRATASDPGGSVARVEFYVDGLLVASDASSPYEATWTAVSVGAHSVTAIAVDNLNATTSSATVPVTVVGGATGTRVNVALAANGATASASSMANANYGPSAAIDGRRSGAGRGQLGSWEDAPASTPDWLQVTFAAPRTIDLVNVFSLQVNSSTPVEPTPTLTSYIAVEDFSVQSWTGAAWVLIPGSQVVGNNLVWRPVAFSPVTTTAIRIVVTKVYGNNTRLTEVEAWTVAGGVQPSATLSASPATITSGGSSTLSWTTSGATSVAIDQGLGAVAATGTQLVAPTATTTYTLTATNAGGSTTSTAVVTVNAAPPTNVPPIVSLTAPTSGAWSPWPPPSRCAPPPAISSAAASPGSTSMSTPSSSPPTRSVPMRSRGRRAPWARTA